MISWVSVNIREADEIRHVQVVAARNEIVVSVGDADAEAPIILTFRRKAAERLRDELARVLDTPTEPEEGTR